MARTELTGKQIKNQSVDLAVDVTGILPVANGGTGSSTLALNSVLLGNGTGALQAVAPGTSGNVLTSNGTAWVSAAPTGGGGAGDVTTNTSSSVDDEVVLFSGTGGKTLKRATGTGWAYVTAGVLSTATPTKSDVGLGNVDNTSDADKPVSTATQTALDGKSDTGHGHAQSDITGLSTDLAGKQDTSEKGQPGGYPSLDSGGKVPTSQLPLFGAVDSVNGQTGVVVLDKGDVGLDQVDNTSDLDKPVSTATQTALDGKADSVHGHVTSDITGLDTALSGISSDISGINTALSGKEPSITAGTTSQYWRGDKSWQTLNKSAVGLGNVDNTADADKPVSSATQAALDGKEPSVTAGTTSQYWRGDKSWQTLDKSAVGLSNVDNTSDATKNSATATLTNKTISGSDNTLSNIPQSAVTNLATDLAGKESTANRNTAGGYAGLDGSGKVAAAQLPSYVDDVVEGADLASLPGTGETGKIYVALDTNKTFRWSGSAYIEISPSPGSTDSVTEGSTNLYFTNARADARISNAIGVSVQGYDADLAAFAAKTAPTGDVVGTSDTQTLSGKTISGSSNTLSNIPQSAVTDLSTDLSGKEPTITAGTTGQYWRGDKSWQTLNAAAVGLGNVDNTSDATKNAATATLTNKTISGSDNTLSNIGNAALTNSSITIAGTSTALGGSISLDTLTGLSGTGLVKRTGANTLAAAVSGTDYAPATSGSGLLKGNGSGGFAAASAGTDYLAPGGALGTPSSGTLTNCTGLPVSGISATGTPGAGTYLRGDGSWATVAAATSGSYVQTIGNGSSTSITVTHNLNTRNVLVSVKEAATYVEVLCDVTASTVNTVTLDFATAPTTNQYVVTILGDAAPAASANTAPFADNQFSLKSAADDTKVVNLSLAGISTGTTRTLTVPDANTTLVGTDTTQTLTNKTIIDPFTTTVTAGGTTTLTATSSKIQEFTGSANQTLVLPSTGVVAGQQFTAINNSSGSINTQASGSGVVHVLGPGVECMFTALVNTPTLPEHWEDSFYGANFAAGKVLTVNSTITLAGTDGTTMTFPGASDTVVTIAASQGLTNKTLTNPTITGYTETVNAIGTVSSTATLSASSGTVLTATLTASTACTFTMPTAAAGKSFVLMLKQAASTGGGTATFTGVKWATAGAPTITSTAGKMDILSFFSDGTNWYGSYTQGYTP